jgi:hypothetical protein
MPAGRPMKYETKEELQIGIDTYVADCEKRDRSLTMSGLAYALDINRQTLLNYSNSDEFFGTVSRARRRVEQEAEERLFSNAANGAKFNLINNFKGWVEKSEQDITSKGQSIAPVTPEVAAALKGEIEDNV